MLLSSTNCSFPGKGLPKENAFHRYSEIGRCLNPARTVTVIAFPMYSRLPGSCPALHPRAACMCQCTHGSPCTWRLCPFRNIDDGSHSREVPAFCCKLLLDLLIEESRGPAWAQESRTL